MREFRRFMLLYLACMLVCPLYGQENQTMTVDASAPATPFPHFWEQMFGSGRAILSLRESYRSDLRAVKEITGFQYVRFHGILLDEVGVYGEAADDAIVTRRSDGTVVLALWNLVDPEKPGAPKAIDLEFRHLPPHAEAVIFRLDKTHGNTQGAYEAMGSPHYPTQTQVEELWKAAKIVPAEEVTITNSHFRLELPAEGLAVIEIK